MLHSPWGDLPEPAALMSPRQLKQLWNCRVRWRTCHRSARVPSFVRWIGIRCSPLAAFVVTVPPPSVWSWAHPLLAKRARLRAPEQRGKPHCCCRCPAFGRVGPEGGQPGFPTTPREKTDPGPASVAPFLPFSSGPQPERPGGEPAARPSLPRAVGVPEGGGSGCPIGEAAISGTRLPAAERSRSSRSISRSRPS
jgi:hypothetical protein